MMDGKQRKRARNVNYSRAWVILRISAEGYIPTNERKTSVDRGGGRGSPTVHSPKTSFSTYLKIFLKTRVLLQYSSSTLGGYNRHSDWAMGWTIRGTYDGSEKDFSFMKSIQTGADAHPAPC